MKQIIRRVAALIIGLGIGAAALAGLETVTHISDLNSSWPLGSDLASTSDDHIRNIKVALKTDFPNINGAVTATPAELNQLTTNAFTSAITVAGNITTSSSGIIRSNGTTGNASVRLQNSGVDKGLFCSSISAGSCTTGDSANDVTLETVGGTLYLGANNGASKQVSLATGGNFTIAAPSSGIALTATAPSGNFAAQFLGAGTAGNNFGVDIDAGLNSSDTGFQVRNSGGTTSYFKVRGDGAITGYGSTAAALVDMSPDTGTFTSTYTGFTAGVTCTSTWSRIGKLVVLALCSATGTSNATSFTMTGLPSAIQPATVTQWSPTFWVKDNGNDTNLGAATITAASGTITFTLNTNSSGWTNALTKGFAHPITLTYLLN